MTMNMRGWQVKTEKNRVRGGGERGVGGLLIENAYGCLVVGGETGEEGEEEKEEGEEEGEEEKEEGEEEGEEEEKEEEGEDMGKVQKAFKTNTTVIHEV
ncbi:unnamed protein product [Gadus morhua 'NCC']